MKSLCSDAFWLHPCRGLCSFWHPADRHTGLLQTQAKQFRAPFQSRYQKGIFRCFYRSDFFLLKYCWKRGHDKASSSLGFLPALSSSPTACPPHDPQGGPSPILSRAPAGVPAGSRCSSPWVRKQRWAHSFKGENKGTGTFARIPLGPSLPLMMDFRLHLGERFIIELRMWIYISVCNCNCSPLVWNVKCIRKYRQT